jgi:hypothetical protein
VTAVDFDFPPSMSQSYAVTRSGGASGQPARAAPRPLSVPVDRVHPNISILPAGNAPVGPLAVHVDPPDVVIVPQIRADSPVFPEVSSGLHHELTATECPHC